MSLSVFDQLKNSSDERTSKPTWGTHLPGEGKMPAQQRVVGEHGTRCPPNKRNRKKRTGDDVRPPRFKMPHHNPPEYALSAGLPNGHVETPRGSAAPVCVNLLATSHSDRCAPPTAQRWMRVP